MQDLTPACDHARNGRPHFLRVARPRE